MYFYNTFWLSYLLKYNISWEPTALQNLGNTCYLNAILQCIFCCDSHTGSLSIHRYNKDGQNDVLQNNLRRLVTSNQTSREDLKNLKLQLGMVDSFFNSREQQDAHEALVKVFNILESITKYSVFTDLIQSSQPGSQIYSSFIEDTFQGFMKNTYTCLVCQNHSIHVEPFYDINIDADGTVEDSIRLSFKSHMMKYCNVCQSDCVASVV